MKNKEALAAGLTTYIGKPCKKGHDGRRYTSNRSCVECDRIAHGLNKEASAAWRRYWYHSNLEKAREMGRRNGKLYRTRHPERVAQQQHEKYVKWINTIRVIYGNLNSDAGYA